MAVLTNDSIKVSRLVPSHAREIAKWTEINESAALELLRSNHTSKYGVFHNNVLFGILVISKITDEKHVVKWHNIFPHNEEEIELEAAANKMLIQRAVLDLKANVLLHFEVSEWKTSLHLLLKELGFVVKSPIIKERTEDMYLFEFLKK